MIEKSIAFKIDFPNIFQIFFFQHHKNVNLRVVLISDKDENAINNGNLFHLSKYSDKRGNVIHKMQIEMIQVPASLVFAAISEF